MQSQGVAPIRSAQAQPAPSQSSRSRTLLTSGSASNSTSPAARCLRHSSSASWAAPGGDEGRPTVHVHGEAASVARPAFGLEATRTHVPVSLSLDNAVRYRGEHLKGLRSGQLKPAVDESARKRGTNSPGLSSTPSSSAKASRRAATMSPRSIGAQPTTRPPALPA